MSLDHYQAATFAAASFSTEALIRAAMLKANPEQAEDLRAAFPLAWKEVQSWYHAPDGVLPGDPVTVAVEPDGGQ